MSEGYGSVRLAEHFQELTDPPRRKVTYPLINTGAITVCAVICGVENFELAAP